jgi:5''-3'' exonuclease
LRGNKRRLDKYLSCIGSLYKAISLFYVSLPQDSPIIDFYPEDFKIDLNGKKFAWQGVALLPFVDEERLHKALAPYYEKLSVEESE